MFVSDHYPSITSSTRPLALAAHGRSRRLGVYLGTPIRQTRARRGFAGFEVTPEGNQQLARQRHDADLAGPLAVVSETPFIPLAERAAGLPAQPVPGQFDQQPTHVLISRLADALLAATLARIERRRRQSHDGADLPAIREATPAEQLIGQQPGAGRPHAEKFQKTTHLVYLRRVVT